MQNRVDRVVSTSKGNRTLTAILPKWRSAPSNLALGTGEVHVWRLCLGPGPAADANALRGLLSEDERRRADRYRFDRHRDRFTVCRGTLRNLLGRYLEVQADSIRFEYGEHGKPSIADPPEGRTICFNLAHSRNLALFAFSRHQAVGIDIEYRRPMPRAEALAKRFFSAEEHRVIQSLSPDHRQQAFYDCWTRKEAYVKATGAGFSFPLARFTVSLAPDEPARLIRVEGSPELAKGWTVVAVVPSADYVAALAVRGNVENLRWWESPLTGCQKKM